MSDATALQQKVMPFVKHWGMHNPLGTASLAAVQAATIWYERVHEYAKSGERNVCIAMPFAFEGHQGILCMYSAKPHQILPDVNMEYKNECATDELLEDESVIWYDGQEQEFTNSSWLSFACVFYADLVMDNILDLRPGSGKGVSLGAPVHVFKREFRLRGLADAWAEKYRQIREAQRLSQVDAEDLESLYGILRDLDVHLWKVYRCNLSLHQFASLDVNIETFVYRLPPADTFAHWVVNTATVWSERKLDVEPSNWYMCKNWVSLGQRKK